MLNIIDSKSHLVINHIQLMIYGAAGVGKTSVACSTKAPLLINFDEIQNALKAFGRPDSVHVSSRPNSQQINWESLCKMTKADLGSYQTLVIDTAGRMVECVGSYVESRFGIPQSSTFKYYGEIKAQVASFLKIINEIGLDIVFVAHEKSDEIRHKTVNSPHISGWTGSEIYRDCLVIGYMSAVTRNQVQLDFDLDCSRIAKNHGLCLRDVPSLENEPKFLGSIIDTLKASLITESEPLEVLQLESEISNMLALGDINGAVITVNEKSDGLPAASVKRIKSRISGMAKERKLVWSGSQYVMP